MLHVPLRSVDASGPDATFPNETTSAFEDPTARRWSSCNRQKNSSNLNQHGAGGAEEKTIGWQWAQHLSRRNQYLHLQVDFTASCRFGKRQGFGNVVDGTMGHGVWKVV